MLFGDDSDGEVTVTINKSYAGRYNSWRQKEELQKLKDRYGEEAVKDAEGSSDGSSSSEDEDAPEFTEEFEKEFFKTLSQLKKKDPSIYDKNTAFFKDTITTKEKQTKKDEKPLFLRDYERKLIVDREGKLSEDEDEDENKRPQSPTIAEEEKIIKESFKGALQDSDDDDDEKDWGGLFQKRQKTKEEEEKEEEDYWEWLKGQKEEISDKKAESDLKYLHDYWNDPKLNPNEKFLRDYILNKKFLDEDGDDDDYIPTYEEIVHDSDQNFSEDEKTVVKQEEFEHKFNFRFEEPDKEYLKRYPRTMENSLRKKDDRRKRKRQEVKERKKAEEAKKREELKRLKSLKRKEIMDKIEKLKELTGNEEVGFKNEDIEGDFDPEEHDKRMRELFNPNFYEEEEGSKPVFPELDEELEIENWDTWDGRNYDQQEEYNSQEEHEPHCEDPDFNMDCDYDPASQFQNELIESTKKKKGKKWKSKFAETVAQKKPLYDSKSHTFEEYWDEYYKLDFEDIIGDLPCRFKYRKVVPNNFGLTVAEILEADDKELNKWCSLKKAVQYRPEHVERNDVHVFRRKAMNTQLKKKIFISVYNNSIEGETSTEKNKSKKMEQPFTENNTELLADNNFKKKKRKHKEDEQVLDYISSAQTDGDEAEVVNTELQVDNSFKKKKRKHKEDKEHVLAYVPSAQTNGDEAEGVNTELEADNSFKKKKKRKHKEDKEQVLDYVPLAEAEGVNTKEKKMKHNSDNHQSSNVGGKKKKKKNRLWDESMNCEVHTGDNGRFNKHKRKQIPNNKFHGKKSEVDEVTSLSDARLRAYGINPKKYKNSLKYGKNKTN